MNPFIEIFIFFIVPTFLFVSGIFHIKYRAWGLTTVGLLIGLNVFLNKWSLERLSIRLDNIKEIWVAYLVATIISIIFIFISSHILKRKFISSWKVYPDAFFSIFFGSFLQEFLFRSYLMSKLGEIFSSVILIITINGLLFALMHMIFPELKIDFPFIFLAGLLFACIYYFFPNLILISVMHMILNFTACSFGFFTLTPELHKINHK